MGKCPGAVVQHRGTQRVLLVADWLGVCIDSPGSVFKPRDKVQKLFYEGLAEALRVAVVPVVAVAGLVFVVVHDFDQFDWLPGVKAGQLVGIFWRVDVIAV